MLLILCGLNPRGTHRDPCGQVLGGAHRKSPRGPRRFFNAGRNPRMFRFFNKSQESHLAFLDFPTKFPGIS